MAGAWVEHVKEYAKQKQINYGEAMKSPECKETYQKNKASIKIEDVKEMTTPKMPKTPKMSRTKSMKKIEEPTPEPIPEPVIEKSKKSKKTKAT